MSTSQKLIAVVAAVVIAVVAIALHLPAFVAPLVVVCGVVAYVRRTRPPIGLRSPARLPCG